MDKISFKAKLYEINKWRILRFPKQYSEGLPSRGMVMIQGTINDIYFETALEPDGMGSHWFRVSDALSESIKADIGDTVSLIIEPMKAWLEPEIPLDLEGALKAAGLMEQWHAITTKARWEWIRWIRFTHNPATAEKRIEVACSMLGAGKKRPCCFDQSRCTVAAVSKGGILLATD